MPTVISKALILTPKRSLSIRGKHKANCHDLVEETDAQCKTKRGSEHAI